jgi:hypothetical protein
MAAPVYFSSVTGAKIDRASSVIEGVSVITSGVEAKGHKLFVDGETLKQVKACADTHSDGVQVKVDHGTGFTSIVGALRNFRIEGNKLLADLHLLKSHEMREQLFEIAETMPGSIGLSISFSGKNEEIGGKEYARCVELYSVDFVDRPAANPSGLFHVDSSPKGIMQVDKTFLEKLKELIGLAEKPAETINFEAKANELSDKLEVTQKQLAEDRAKSFLQLSELTTAKEKAEAEAAKAKTDFEAKEKNLAEEVKKQASAQALQITQAQGQPPIAAAPTATPAAPAPAKSELKGLAKVQEAIRKELSASGIVDEKKLSK